PPGGPPEGLVQALPRRPADGGRRAGPTSPVAPARGPSAADAGERRHPARELTRLLPPEARPDARRLDPPGRHGPGASLPRNPAGQRGAWLRRRRAGDGPAHGRDRRRVRRLLGRSDPGDPGRELAGLALARPRLRRGLPGGRPGRAAALDGRPVAPEATPR